MTEQKTDRCTGSLAEVEATDRVLVVCPVCAKRVFPQDRKNLKREGVPVFRVSNHR